MENITIGQIASAIGLISLIGSFIVGIIAFIIKWWKSKITKRFDNIEERLNYVEEKRVEYEHEVENSKFERKILLKGELAALKGLYAIKNNDLIATSIQEIEEYMMEKSHD